MAEENYDGKTWNDQDPKLTQSKIYVSSELLKNYNNNDLYLLNQTNQLWDTTSINTRKTFSPIPVDEIASFNVVTTNDGAKLDNSEDNTFTISFNEDMIDTSDKTTALIETNNKITVPKEIPDKAPNKCTRNYSPLVRFEDGDDNVGKCDKIKADDSSCNSYWYIGYNRSSKYNLKPAWINNQNSFKIPSVCRAQVFKAEATGKIERINMLLGANGIVNERFPLIVDVVPCEKNNYSGIWYPTSLKYAKKIWDNVKVPSESIQSYSRFALVNKLGGEVQKDKYYAIILRSPLTKYNNAYRVGGWGKHCGAIDYGQYAFLSEDNGLTWKIYGKKDNVSYKMGKVAPETFSFMVEIKETNPEYKTDKEYYLYSKRIDTNPCKYLSCSYEIENKEKGEVKLHIWDNQSKEWAEINAGSSISYNAKKIDELPDTFIVRITLKASNIDSAPAISNLNIHVQTHPALNGILRTKSYIPNTNGILGANVYSKLNVPVERANESKSSAYVDIVSERIESETFNLIIFDELLATELKEKIPEIVNHEEDIKKIIDETKVDEKDKKIISFLTNNTELVKKYNEQGYYILDDPNFKGFDLWDDVAEPLISFTFIQDGQIKKEEGKPDELVNTGKSLEFSEWIDYEVNYDTGHIELYTNTIGQLEQGYITVRYHPLFLKGIEQGDIPVSLDVYSETFEISEEESKESKIELPMKMAMVDPLRDVLIDADTPKEIELKEFEEYEVEYETKTVIIKRKLSPKSKITVKYTPLLDDPSISLQYRLSRETTTDDVIVKPYSITTRI